MSRRLTRTAYAAAAATLAITTIGLSGASAASAAVPDQPMPGATLSVAGEGNERTDLVYTGTSGQVWRVYMSPMGQNTPQSWGGKLIGGPAAVWIPRGTLPISGLAVFGRGTDNHLWWRHETSSGLSAWTPLGGRLTSKPSVTLGSALAPNTLTVFVRGDNGAVWSRTLHGTGNPGQVEWTPWTSGGGWLLAGTGPVAVGNAAGLFVVAVGTNRVIYVSEHLVGKTLPWRPIGGKTISDPGIASPSPNAVIVFVRGLGATLWYNEFFGHTNGVGAGWNAIGGILRSGVTAITQQEGGVFGATSVFVLGADNKPWMRTGMWPALSGWFHVRINY